MVECLLIDGNQAERKRLAKLLADLGLDCAERAQADEGLRYCHQRVPAVVMMEASAAASTRDFLQKMNFTVHHSISPIIILYADRPNVDAVVQSIYDGAAEFLARPFDRDLLKFKLVQAGVLRH